MAASLQASPSRCWAVSSAPSRKPMAALSVSPWTAGMACSWPTMSATSSGASRPPRADVDAHAERLRARAFRIAIDLRGLARGGLVSDEAQLAIDRLRARIPAAHEQPREGDALPREGLVEECADGALADATLLVRHEDALEVDRRRVRRTAGPDHVAARSSIDFDDAMLATLLAAHGREVLLVRPLADEVAVLRVSLERRDESKILGT